MGTSKGTDDLLSVFDSIFRECYAPLCRFASSLISDINISEDVVQEVFADIWKRRDSLVLRKDIENYLFVAVRNNCFARLKKNKPLRLDIKDHGEDLFSDENTEEHLGEKQRSRILEIVNTLPEQRRAVLKLIVWEGYSYAEVAEKLGLSKNTVKSHLKLAYKELRSKLNTSEIFAFLYFLKKQRPYN